jgi:hypothetical protein
MKHIRDLLRETAVPGTTSGGDVAGVRGSLFSRPIKREKTEVPKIRVIRFHHDSRGRLRESVLNKLLKETNTGGFKTADIMSKLKSAQKTFNFDKDSVSFGLEDDNGNTVKVYVRATQAAEFEKALSEILHDYSSEQDLKEIPEILFSLKDKFEIIHVDWGNVEEDEEEPTQVPDATDDSTDVPDDKQDDDEDVQGDPDEPDMNADMDAAAGNESALDKVLAMLKADAEAKTAEANAKTAEANAKEAEYALKAAEFKIKGEEDVLDMEAFFKKQTDEKKETQKLAKLARWRHEKALDAKNGYDDEDDEVDDDDEDTGEMSQ